MFASNLSHRDRKPEYLSKFWTKTWWWWQAMAPHSIPLPPWPSRPPAIETPPRPVSAGPLISWPKNASCSRIPPRASRYMLFLALALAVALALTLARAQALTLARSLAFKTSLAFNLALTLRGFSLLPSLASFFHCNHFRLSTSRLTNALPIDMSQAPSLMSAPSAPTIVACIEWVGLHQHFILPTVDMGREIMLKTKKAKRKCHQNIVEV